MNNFKKFIPIASICTVLFFTACKEKNDNPDKTAANEAVPGIILANMDTTVSPKTDFYNFVNGNWMKNNTIPDDQSSWGGFTILRKQTDKDMLALLAKAKESGAYGPKTDQAKALFLYESILDTAARNKKGVSELIPVIKKIEAVNSVQELQKLLAENVLITAPYWDFYVFANLSDSNINAGYISSGNLGLPERDYYLNNDAKSKEIRQKYVDHITKMLQIIGEEKEKAGQDAKAILALETQLAKPRLSKEQRRDARNFNNPRTLAQLQNLTPAVNWKQYLKDLGLKKEVDTVIVMEPAYMKALQKILTTTDIEKLKTLTKWSTLNKAASSLDTAIEQANFDFYNKTLYGQKKMKPADERALSKVNGSIGEALGKIYVDEMFPPEAKTKAEDMISNIIEAFKERVNKLDWMSDDTKKQAIEKLGKFTVKIGYPDKWEDYSKLAIKEGNSYFQNRIAVEEWAKQDNLADFGEPVDKTKWGMSPQTVNAYYNPLANEIVFPAAILQPPFYNYTADAAVNYGGIGAVIGHEISHAFDDSGARFDSNGNLRNWWTKEDMGAFTERVNALANQYSKVEVLDSVFVNGKFTSGENIGDLGGVLGAYDGLQKYLAEHGNPGKIDGFTPKQRFFMSWATIWRTLTRDDALRTRINTDPHSPGKVRAVQPLLNVDAFYEAFDIKEGDSLYLPKEKRVRIW
ncbi:MAG: endothelin-converting protein [Flavobacteriales bacterium]|nr:MAG: endothelin-converting protein [Flavobacteriales bacterium]